MKEGRKRKHPKYYAIKGYQILSRLTDEEVARQLGCTVRTYNNKINGRSDFTAVEGEMLSSLFGVSQDEIFLT